MSYEMKKLPHRLRELFLFWWVQEMIDEVMSWSRCELYLLAFLVRDMLCLENPYYIEA